FESRAGGGLSSRGNADARLAAHARVVGRKIDVTRTCAGKLVEMKPPGSHALRVFEKCERRDALHRADEAGDRRKDAERRASGGGFEVVRLRATLHIGLRKHALQASRAARHHE